MTTPIALSVLERKNAILISASEIGTAVVAISVGVLTSSSILTFPQAVRLLVLIAGVVSLSLTNNIFVSFYNNSLMGKKILFGLCSINIVLFIGLMLSFSPILNSKIAEIILFPLVK